MQEVVKAISLKNKGDFLMHRVVLQNRMFRPTADVSRETFLRKKDSRPSQARRCFT
jgi:hypothetical protein